MKTSFSILHRSLVFLYGIASYLVGMLSLAYASGFIGDFLVPKSIDSPATTPFWQALLVNCGLLAVFALQHSIMARPAFKRRWTRIVPEAAERSTYVLFSGLALILLFAFWQPMGGTIWQVTNLTGQAALYAMFASGWLLVVGTTLLINHLDLFGLRQVWLHLRGHEYTPVEFKTPSLYKLVRHPLYAGLLLAFWATPTMTVAHLVFALMTTAYILIAIRLEERDLIVQHPEYAAYRRRVPMLVPAPRRSA